ncbi:hypothetical protein HBF26_17065 [Luteibacter jiangsuensis]|uniref:Uncharacterized protein n=1 Tax=Luteibacter jiangsuensis TaxID=637577 RepID=A0ABX0Q7U0_9GAMM|nr:hypothetical protein [Luteibacter jiangsuensis]NID06609.1 hypothetical protein [Luteibacter jiangsuensis]
MTKYAQGTTVSSDKSRAEIESTLRRYGATSFMYGSAPDRAIIAFEAFDRRVKFELPMPNPQATEFTRTPGRNHLRSPADAAKAYEAAVRQKWRALALCIKAKLEAVESGITTFEAEFLAHIVLPNGRTVHDEVAPTVSIAYQSGKVVPLLGKF